MQITAAEADLRHSEGMVKPGIAAMRDMQADWKHWSAAERVLAVLLLAAASLAIGTIVLVQA
jgi:hypothetical protein